MANELIITDFPCQCGSTERFMEGIAAKERAKGNIPLDIPTALYSITMAVANPNPVIPYMPGTVKPGGTALYDICMKCGREYCFRVIEAEVVLGAFAMMLGKKPGHP